jgi:ferredoxin
MILVPLGLTGHVILWEGARSGMNWWNLPNAWADALTLLFLGLAAFFLFRRLAIRAVRQESTLSGNLFVVMAALPFISGFCLMHGNLDSIHFLEKNLRIIHVLSGELVLIAGSFFLCGMRLHPNQCTACAACVTRCPTGSLMSRESEEKRFVDYTSHQCVSCGECFISCPENAVNLGHEFGLRRLFSPFSKRIIKAENLAACKGCGTRFWPEAQLEKISAIIPEDYVHLCADCKSTGTAARVRRTSGRVRDLDTRRTS